tara:strand:- start:1184 stop:2158 length:975 start_codon:yes stop_codon:yes gene_type:complete
MNIELRKVLGEPKFIAKDFYHFFSNNYKWPRSYFFTLLPYQFIRTVFDNYLTNKSQNKFINKYKKDYLKDKFEEAKRDGVIVNKEFINRDQLVKLNEICNKIVNEPKKHNAVDDGYRMRSVGQDSVHQYFRLPTFSEGNDLKNTDEVKYIHEILFSNDKLLDQLTFFSGVKPKKNEIEIAISKDKGWNSNDDWHTDCYCHTAKAFLYLNDIEKNDSPFCFLKGSHKDIEVRYKVEKENLTNLIFKKNKTENKIADPEVYILVKETTIKDKIYKKYDLLECTFPAGSLVVADTSGFHRKGDSNGSKERFMINVSVHRGSMIKKLF